MPTQEVINPATGEAWAPGFDPFAGKPTEEAGIFPGATRLQELARSQVEMVDTESAISRVNRQNQYLDKTYPTTPQLPEPAEPPKPGQLYQTPTGTAPEGYEWKKENTGEWVLSKLTPEMVPTDEAEPTTPATGLEAEYQQVAGQVEDLTNDFLSYNVDQDPEFQRQAQGIKSEFDKMRREMGRINEQRQRAYETLGYRTGATQYAGAIQMGIVSEEITQGNERMAEITRQENETLAAARSAFKTGKYNEFNVKVEMLKDIREQKANELANYNEAIVNFNKRLKTEQDLLMKQQQFAQEQLVFRQQQEERMAGLIAPNLISLDETGRIQEISESEIQALAKEANVNPLVLRRAMNTYTSQLSTIQAEQRKAALSELNTTTLIAQRQWQMEREQAMYPFEQQKMFLELEKLTKEATGQVLSDDDKKVFMDIKQRASVDPDIKGFIDIRDAYDRVQASAKDPSAAGDLALIFNYMKVLDPGSVVREGEFANAESSGSVPDRIWKTYNKVLRGERLSTDMRADFLDRAGRLYEPKERNYLQAVEEYKADAAYLGLPGEAVERVVREYLTPAEVIKPFVNQDEITTRGTPQQKQLYFDLINNPTIRRGIQDGDITQQDLFDEFNKRIGAGEERGGEGVGQKMAMAYKVGSHGGQCGEFSHKFVDFPPMGNTFTEKKRSINKHGIRKEEGWEPRIGDVVITDGSDVTRGRRAHIYGHVAVITGFDKSGNLVLTESNRRGDEKVTTGRIISPNHPAIYGAFKGKIKQKFIA